MEKLENTKAQINGLNEAKEIIRDLAKNTTNGTQKLSDVNEKKLMYYAKQLRQIAEEDESIAEIIGEMQAEFYVKSEYSDVLKRIYISGSNIMEVRDMQSLREKYFEITMNDAEGKRNEEKKQIEKQFLQSNIALVRYFHKKPTKELKTASEYNKYMKEMLNKLKYITDGKGIEGIEIIELRAIQEELKTFLGRYKSDIERSIIRNYKDILHELLILGTKEEKLPISKMMKMSLFNNDEKFLEDHLDYIVRRSIELDSMKVIPATLEEKYHNGYKKAYLKLESINKTRREMLMNRETNKKLAVKDFDIRKQFFQKQKEHSQNLQSEPIEEESELNKKINEIADEINQKVKSIEPLHWGKYITKLEEIYTEHPEVRDILRKTEVTVKKNSLTGKQVNIGLDCMVYMKNLEKIRQQYFALPDEEKQTDREKQKAKILQYVFRKGKTAEELIYARKENPLKTANEYLAELQKVVTKLKGMKAKNPWVKSYESTIKNYATQLIPLINYMPSLTNTQQAILKNYKNAVCELYAMKVKEENMPVFNLLEQQNDSKESKDKKMVEFIKEAIEYYTIRHDECEKEHKKGKDKLQSKKAQEMQKKYQEATQEAIEKLFQYPKSLTKITPINIYTPRIPKNGFVEQWPTPLPLTKDTDKVGLDSREEDDEERKVR